MSGSASSDLYRKKDFGSFNKIGQKLGLINLCKKFSVAQSNYLNYRISTIYFSPDRPVVLRTVHF